MNKLFLFGIGGTGARVIRSFTMMLAAGFRGADSNLEVVPIILDHDKSNGDLDRTKKVLDAYRDINRALYPDAGKTEYKDSFFVPRVTSLGQVDTTNAVDGTGWHVEFGAVARNSQMKFSDYIGLPSIASLPDLSPTESLVKCLYNDEPTGEPDAELNIMLKKGFLGNPSIGTVVFNELKFDTNFQKFLGACQDGDRVFIVGSVFGGTGSSGIPVIVDEIRRATTAARNVPIGVALVLPYFKVARNKSDSGDSGAIKSDMFNAKTVAALSSYDIGGNESFNRKVTDLYYVGDNFSDEYEYHEGANKQQNRAHVVEWVAATAIIDFWLRKDEYGANNFKEYGILADGNDKAIDLTQITDTAKTEYVDDFSAFVFAMRFYLEAVHASRKPLRDSTAFLRTFNLSNNLKSGVYDKIKKFVENNVWGLYTWLEELADHAHSMKLYNAGDNSSDLSNVLAHKTVTGGFLRSNPASDGNVADIINNLTRNTSDKTPKAFFKALHDASTQIIDKIKK